MFSLVLLFFFLSGPDWINSYNIGDCGIRYKKAEPFKRATDKVEYLRYNEFPWHVALYKMENNSTYHYICGGSIIDTNIVMTVAHCVYDEIERDIDYGKMIIAVGKYNSSWEHRDANEQRFEVISKKLRPTYTGSQNKFKDDIALLVLNDTIKFSSGVMPVCVDWADLYKTLDNEIGTVVGWGLDENRVLSDRLKSLEIKLSSHAECRKNIEKSYNLFITSDKFCSHSNDDRSIGVINSGGGLVLSKSQGDDGKSVPRHFLKGILSGRAESYLLLTNIRDHMSWINSTLQTITAENIIRKSKKKQM